MTLLILVFALGYIAIIAEHPLKINKTATALIAGGLCWVVYAWLSGGAKAAEELTVHLPGIAGILLFLMAAMTIVELIDLHDGFAIITDRISSRNPVVLLWIISLVTFFLSAILDNLTTAIVMCSLLRKLVSPAERKFFAGIVVIAANSGGAFSPIGDVTTTMLWLGGQISAWNIIRELFIPSIISLIIPLIWVSFVIRKRDIFSENETIALNTKQKGSKVMLLAGILILVLVPVFKIVTGLPPYLGILLGLGIMWLFAEVMHRGTEQYKTLSAANALSRIDVPSILFFFGILAAVSALESAGLLEKLAHGMDRAIGNKDVIVSAIGLSSAVIDNVPLVAASMGMYNLAQYPMDSKIWEFLAYAAGTGGSIFIIGSAAGVAVMGMEKIDFIWYLKRISLFALVGYFAGIAAYLAIYAMNS